LILKLFIVSTDHKQNLKTEFKQFKASIDY